MAQRPLRVFISAGEHSGDSHGAALAKRLREREPEIVLQGMGGPLMQQAGVEIPFDFVEHAAMGLVNVLKALPFFTRTLKETAARLIADPPDVLVPIDYPGFNLRLSGKAKKAGIQVAYYVSPQVWAWRPSRIHRIARLVDHMMVLFPFEQALYEAVGVPCTFVGHPLFDELRLRKRSPAFRDGLGLDPATPLLGILPGSRRQEIERNLPLELKAANLIHAQRPDVRYAIPVAQQSLDELTRKLVAEHAPDLPIQILEGKASDIARVSRAALCASGTATLELLHYECPMVVIYQATRAQAVFVKRLLTTEWIGLVNVLAQREICPEFADHKDRSAEIAEAALGLLGSGKARKQCLTRMRNLKAEVDVKGAHPRAAETVLRLAREARSQGAPPSPPRPAS